MDIVDNLTQPLPAWLVLALVLVLAVWLGLVTRLLHELEDDLQDLFYERKRREEVLDLLTDPETIKTVARETEQPWMHVQDVMIATARTLTRDRKERE